MPNFFIDRPNFAWVIAIFLCLAGVLAMGSLGVSQYPNVAPPQIAISASYPGASAELVEQNVTSRIEEQLNGVKGLLYFESTSDGTSGAQVTATFEPGTDPDVAQIEVQNRLKRVEPRLPEAVLKQGIDVVQTAGDTLLFFALRYLDDSRDAQALADFTERNINNEIRRVPGVGSVKLYGSGYAMRVWLLPEKMLGLGLSVDDVTQAIRAQNVAVTAGSIGAQPTMDGAFGDRVGVSVGVGVGGAPMAAKMAATGDASGGGFDGGALTMPIQVRGQLSTVKEFSNIVLRANSDGAVVRLSDVARVAIGRESYDFTTRLNGREAVAVGVKLLPGANALMTAKAVKDRLKALEPNMPADVAWSVPYDTSRFVAVAIEKVVYTLLEAVVLVFLVMFLFLQSVRYTLIPTIVVPVCLLGTLAAMWVLGFSINMMTMFGMVLAIGILVDDAIIVVENVERLMAQEGLSPKDATRKAMRQISGAIVGITLVLSGVFLPLAFMDGSVGMIYRQFSMALAVSILLSGFLALTLTPALCATLLKPVPADHHEKKGFFGWFNRGFSRGTDRYHGISGKLVRRPGRTMLVYLLIVGGLAVIYSRLPSSFLPTEDKGVLAIDVQLPPGATLARTVSTLEAVEAHLASRPAIASTIAVTGWSFSGSGQNAAILFPTMIDWSKRSSATSAQAEANLVNETLATLKDGRVMAVVPPPIPGLGSSSGFAFRLQDRGGIGLDALRAARDHLLVQANKSSVLAYARAEGLDDMPMIQLEIDRTRADALGVSFSSIRATLSAVFGSEQVSDFPNRGRIQPLVVQADASARMTPAALRTLNVPNKDNQMVPLSEFTDFKWKSAPSQLSRYNGYPSYNISGDAAPGHSTGEAMQVMEALVAKLPPGIGYEWTGGSLQEKQSDAQAGMLLGLSLLVVFLLLVALYESWTVPFAVILIVPIGALGAVLAVTALGMSNDVYFKVGLVTIIGLAAKNAILIVEFAKTLHDEGMSLRDAALEAARLRFRPIVMTSMAFIFGVLPLALANGAGAASQHSIGVGVIGGMLGATVLGVFFVPVFFVWVLGLKKQPTAASLKPQ